jgi:uncharacterized BrkB/YihY/UPF0761 family membrane protein
MLFTPSVALAHEAVGFVVGWSALSFFISLIASFFLLKRFNQRNPIDNKFIRFIILFVLGLLLLCILTLSLYLIGIFGYILYK